MSDETPQVPTEEPMTSAEWKQFRDDRRRMAWLCLISLLFVTAAALFYLPIERVAKLDNIITWFYMTTTSIVGLYFGVKSWVQISGKKK